MLKAETADSILSLYDYKPPFSVAEYFCYAFRDIIVCNKPLNYKLFKNFLKHRDNTFYIFQPVIGEEKYKFTKLSGIEILIPIGEEDNFMDEYSNWVFSSSATWGFRAPLCK